MKKRALSLLVCVCLLAGLLGVSALAAGDDVLPTMPAEPTLYLDGVALTATAEGTTHTFENGGVATLTAVGQNEAGGTDFALTLENIQAAKSTRMAMGENTYAANLFFLSGQPMTRDASERKDTLAITLKGRNMISIQGQADEAVATALVSQCSTSVSGEGSLLLRTALAEGAQTVCVGVNVTGDLSVGASVQVMGALPALALGGELTFTDGATLRWPTEQVLSQRTDAPMGLAGRVLMNGETAADMLVVAMPSTPVTRGVMVFNLWRLQGSPKPEGAYPFADEPKSDFMRDAIHWAGTTGLAQGYGDGEFHEMDQLTSEQFAVMAYRLSGSPAVTGELPADATVSPWARDAVLWGMAQGAPATTDPQGVFTHGTMDSLLAGMARAD